MTNPALKPQDAADYLGCSRRHFIDHIAPFLPCADVAPPGSRKAMPRYRLADLDAWLAERVQPAHGRGARAGAALRLG